MAGKKGNAAAEVVNTVAQDATHSASVTTGNPAAGAPKEVADYEISDFDIDSLIMDERDDDGLEANEEENIEEGEETADEGVTEPDTGAAEGSKRTKETTELVEESGEDSQQEQLNSVSNEEREEEEPASQESVQEQVPVEPSRTTEEINAAYEDFFKKSVDVLADNVYGFDEATKELLDTNPSEVMSKLAAQLHMQVLASALTQVYNLFPTMLQEHQGRLGRVQAAEDGFYKEYPQLKAHKNVVNRIAQVYAQANPGQKDPKIVASEVAAMAMVQARIPMPGSQPQEQQAQTPVTPTSARGGVPPSRGQQKPTTWDELISDED